MSESFIAFALVEVVRKKREDIRNIMLKKNPLDDLAEYHGSRRLVVSNNGRHIYYTSNHYTSFKRLLV
jgi:hypothetical protein